QGDIGWIKFTHVCRKWRQVALAYSSVWGDISLSLGPKWTEEMISRSRGIPLRL
ncbi:hypothetical protein BC834DRAFT_802812, partial [Gloeopeniophorella convolvens]